MAPNNLGERNRIVKVLLLALHEEPAYRVYRFDIRRFFDSLNIQDVLRRIKSEAVSQKTLELLVSILNQHAAGVVDVNLAERSQKRTLTRIAKAFRQFGMDGKFDDLYLRITYLTSNYRLFDPLVNRKRLAGLHHNHPYLTYHRDSSLQKLDGALRTFIFSSASIRGTNGITLNIQQKRDLSTRSFLRGHKNKEYFSFSISTLARIKRCWFDG